MTDNYRKSEGCCETCEFCDSILHCSKQEEYVEMLQVCDKYEHFKTVGDWKEQTEIAAAKKQAEDMR